VAVGLCCLVFLLPLWGNMTFDNEGMQAAVFSTITAARSLAQGWYPFWSSDLALGTPQPFSQHLIYHPLMILFDWLPASRVLFAMYLLHLCLGAGAVFALCRHLGARPVICLTGALTYLGSASTINFVYTDFWPTLPYMWALLPLIFLALLKLLDCPDRQGKLLYSLCLALLGGLLVLNGHMGIYPVHLIALAVFLAMRWRLTWANRWWLLLAMAIAVVVASSKFLDLYVEYQRFAGQGSRRFVQDQMEFSLWVFLLGPMKNLWAWLPEGWKVRSFELGLPFAVLAVMGALHSGITNPHRRALALAALVSAVLMFMPSSLNLLIISWYTAFRDPLLILAVMLAALRLQFMLTQEGATGRRWAMVLVGLQILAVVGFVYPYWTYFLTHEQRSGKVALSSVFERRPLIAALRKLNQEREGRVMLSPRVQKAAWDGALMDLGLTINGLFYHGLRTLNSDLKGISYGEVYPNGNLMQGTALVEEDTLRHQPLLDALAVRYVLALEGEKVASGLKLVHSFRLRMGGRLLLYLNPSAWPSAVLLRTGAVLPQALPRRDEAAHDRLLGRDFSPLMDLRAAGEPVKTLRYAYGRLAFALPPAGRVRSLLISEYYRPGWQARALLPGRGWRAAPVHPALGALLLVEIPAGATRVDLSYLPRARAVLTALSWGGVLLLAGGVAVLAWRRRRARAAA
jgi:hypothetical protein